MVPGEEHPHSSTTSARRTDMNQVADMESRSMTDRSDWKLDCLIFLEINRCYRNGPVCIQTNQPVSLLLQLVARSICRSNQCIPPGLEDNERLCQPPWNLVSRVQRKAQSQEADVILIASIWKIQPWYPLLLARLVDWPRLLPKHGPVPCQCP